jgi:hypothetical protein
MKMVLTDTMIQLINDVFSLQGKIVNKKDVNGIQEVILYLFGKYLFVLINLLLMTVARIVRIEKQIVKFLFLIVDQHGSASLLVSL